MATFTQTEVPLDRSQIRKVELYSGLNFPKEYVDHLLIYNGGKCQPDTFYFIENGTETASILDWFLAIYDGEYDNLKSYIEDFKIGQKRLPDNLLPVAHDPGGNLICISCSGSDIGHIYFWDSEKEMDLSRNVSNEYANVYFIAPSLTEFINGLKEE